jgi:hypothetical protein
MKVTITDNDLTNHEIEIFHDIDGNVFFKNDNTYYYLTISSKDDIELIRIDDFDSLVSVEVDIKYNKIKNALNDKSLKGKIINELTEKKDDDEYIDEDLVDINNLKYHPEDKNHYIENDNQDNSGESDIDENEVKFSFSKNAGTNIIKCITKTLDVPANYDTFIIDNFNKSVLATMHCNEESNYRISITTVGLIELNIVGTKMKSYKIIFKEKLLSCEKLNLGVSQFL